MPDRPETCLAAWSRVTCYAEKLAASLDELEGAGGACRAATVGCDTLTFSRPG